MINATFDYLAGTMSLPDLYSLAIDLDVELYNTRPDSLAKRVAGMIVLATAEEPTGLHGRDETHRLIVDRLREETFRVLREAGELPSLPHSHAGSAVSRRMGSGTSG